MPIRHLEDEDSVKKSVKNIENNLRNPDEKAIQAIHEEVYGKNGLNQSIIVKRTASGDLDTLSAHLSPVTEAWKQLKKDGFVAKDGKVYGVAAQIELKKDRFGNDVLEITDY